MREQQNVTVLCDIQDRYITVKAIKHLFFSQQRCYATNSTQRVHSSTLKFANPGSLCGYHIILHELELTIQDNLAHSTWKKNQRQQWFFFPDLLPSATRHA